MKKFGLNKRNPNPPWPSEQPVIAVPPGTTAEAVGMPGEAVHVMSNTEAFAEDSAGRDMQPGDSRGNIMNSNFHENGAAAENAYSTGESDMQRESGMQRENGMYGENAGNMTQRMQQGASVQDGSRRFPIMGNMPGSVSRGMMSNDMMRHGSMMQGGMPSSGMMNGSTVQNGMMPGGTGGAMRCGTYITSYLCSHVGSYIRIEFLFGEQTHVEKTGILYEVGKNYVVVREMGTNTMVVCSLNKIKFINIYEVNGEMLR